MKQREMTLAQRWIGALSCVGIGSVFLWVLWMDDKAGVGLLSFAIGAAFGLYFLCASDEILERTPWWYF